MAKLHYAIQVHGVEPCLYRKVPTMGNPRFGRMIPAMVTPMKDNLDLDLDRAQELADRLVKGGADSLIINGTTGESPTVFYPDKIELFKAVVAAVDGRIPVIANVGDNCTADTVGFASDVAKLGVDGFMCVVPYYNKPPQEGLYQHFSTIARSVELPIILYNIPGRCAVNMTAETSLRLAHDLDNVVAIKEASGSFEQVKAIVEGAPEGFCVYSGDDSATYDIMKLGGVGVISTIGNVAPARMKEIVELCAADQIYENPMHPYTKALLSAIPPESPFQKKERIVLQGEIPSPIGDQVGCPLAGRCPYCTDRCKTELPELKDRGDRHQVACFLYE